MLVVYSSRSETLICESDHENTLKQEYFDAGGRNYDDYNRETVPAGRVIEVTSDLHSWVG